MCKGDWGLHTSPAHELLKDSVTCLTAALRE